MGFFGFGSRRGPSVGGGGGGGGGYYQSKRQCQMYVQQAMLKAQAAKAARMRGNAATAARYNAQSKEAFRRARTIGKC